MIALRTGEVQVVGELAAEQAFSFRAPTEPPTRPKIRPRVYEPEPTLVHPITRRKIPRPAAGLAPPTPSMTFAPPPQPSSVPSMPRVDPAAPWPSGPTDYAMPFYRGAPSSMRSEPPPPVSYNTPPPGQPAIVSRTLVLKSRPTAWWAMALVVFGMSVGFIFTVLSNKSADPVDAARASTDVPKNAAQPPPAQPTQAQPTQAQPQPQPVSVPVAEPPPHVPVAPSVPATTAAPPPAKPTPSPAPAKPIVRTPPKPVAPATRVVKPAAPPPPPPAPAPAAPKKPSGKDDDDLARARKETSTTL